MDAAFFVHIGETFWQISLYIWQIGEIVVYLGMGKEKKYTLETKPKSMAGEMQIAYGQVPITTMLSDYKYVDLLQKGVSAEEYLSFSNNSLLSLEELATIFHITSRTLRRIKVGHTLNKDLSEKVLQLKRLYTLGKYVLEDTETFVQWLRKPLLALDGATPLSYLDSAFGIDIITKLLGRIEYGVYS